MIIPSSSCHQAKATAEGVQNSITTEWREKMLKVA